MFDNYIEQYGRRLYGLCLTLCKVRTDADDLYQETWLKAYQKQDRYNSSLSFEPWITKICVNLYRDNLRHRNISPIFDNFDDTEEKDRLMANTLVEMPEDYSELHAAVDRLPSKMRIAVILHYFNDLDEKRTAKSLGVPIGTVKSRLYKAREILRKELKNEHAIQFYGTHTANTE